MYAALVRLSDKCVAAETWLHKNFTTGRDETWLGVLEKYQRGAKLLSLGTRMPSSDQWSLPAQPISESRSGDSISKSPTSISA
jgi:hypothetical protein